ncbi:unnamed protein product [Echinostoma caproni]|uniref:Signal recognition particle receptor subunit beta n=1 Tax=Echinostoma caproni TaxID=27848 RepID=A0A183B5Z1_9TREM|nr:unnamed protein product [Echinostoma caproni]
MTNLLLPVVVAALLCIVVSCVLYFYGRKKRTAVLLLGICESGKTAIFSSLTNGKCLPSYTSLKENIGTLERDADTELKDVAEFLYNILTDPHISGSGTHILIACNKQDSSSAKGCAVVRSLLEKEL